MVTMIITLSAVGLMLLAELIHLVRIKNIAKLAFGNFGMPLWVVVAPILRCIAIGGLCWGLSTLYFLEPSQLKLPKGKTLSQQQAEELRKHVVVVLDVSPSMRCVDAGPDKKQKRIVRGWTVLRDFFKRVPIKQYRVSVVAVYNGAIPVVVDTTDMEVFENIMNELPMHHAFKSGDTDLFAGLEQTVKIVKPWRPKSTSVIVLSDGDTIPAKGMPKMPASVRDVLVVGVGDPNQGTFLNGEVTRQDASTLKQLSIRMNGTYLNGNDKPLSAAMLSRLLSTQKAAFVDDFTTRQWALLSIAISTMVLSLLPLVLHYFGTSWSVGRSKEPTTIKAPQMGGEANPGFARSTP